MAAVGLIYYNVLDYATSRLPISSGANIFDDLSVKGIVGAVPGASYFTKIGILARPGTIVVMDNKTIMIGASGMYELDEGIKIERMYFKRPTKYKKDEIASDEAIREGAKKILAARDKKDAALAALGPAPDPNTADTLTIKTYWSQFNKILADFKVEYDEALALFNKGKNGIYVLPYPDEPNNPGNYDDLYNVIIDFIYE